MDGIVNNQQFNNGLYGSVQQKVDTNNVFGAFPQAQSHVVRDEIKLKAKENIQNNSIVSTTKKIFQNDDTKRTIKAIFLAIGTVVGLAVIGNKLSTHTSKLGEQVDKILLNRNSSLGKIYGSCADSCSSIWNKIKSPFKKSAFFNEISDTFKNNHARPVWNMARGYERGPVGIFSLTPVDILKTSLSSKERNKAVDALAKFIGDTPTAMKIVESPEQLSKCIKTISDEAAKATGPAADNLKKLLSQVTLLKNSHTEILNEIGKLVGKEQAPAYFSKLLGSEGIVENRQFCEDFCKAVLSNVRKQNLAKGLSDTQIFEALQKGKLGDIDFSKFTNVSMNQGNILCSWWPVNIINSIKMKIAPKSAPFGKGNLGDSLIKFNAINGTAAQTWPAKFVQKLVTLPTECISNFVNDKSGLGAFISLNLISLFKNVQKAPKEKKAATIADDFGSSIAGWVIATPLAFKTTYALATLANLKGTNFFSKYLLKPIGKVFHMGLGLTPATTKLGKVGNGILGLTGAAMRFILILFVFAGMYQKPIRKGIHKIFGKPYEETPTENVASQQNNSPIIPELNITQAELMEKLQKNPQVLVRLQNDIELQKQFMANPKIILDLLDNKEVAVNNNTSTFNQNPLNDSNSQQYKLYSQFLKS